MPIRTTPTPRCGGKAATKVGTAAADVLRGTPAADVIAGLGDHDYITGVGADDADAHGRQDEEQTGVDVGADQDVAIARERGLPVYHDIAEVPGVAA